MSDETQVVNDDPFAPAESLGKTKFGLLRLYSTPVQLESGAGYTLPDVKDKDGNIREWKGKRHSAGSKTRHIVMRFIATNKDGVPYSMPRDFLASDKGYKTIVYPSLEKVFGKNKPVNGDAPCQIEEVPTGETFKGRDVDPETGENVIIHKTAWKTVKRFLNAAEMKVAETDFFSQFGGSDSTPAADTTSVGAGWNSTLSALGYDESSWKSLTPKLRQLYDGGQSPQQISAMFGVPVTNVKAALGVK